MQNYPNKLQACCLPKINSAHNFTSTSSAMNSRSNSSLRILLLSPEYTPELSGGVGTCMQELADALCQAGCEVLIVACTYRRSGIFREMNKTVHLLEPVNKNGANKQQQSIVEGILAFNQTLISYTRKLIAEQRPDAIHCQNWVTFIAGLQLSVEFKIPLITSVHYLAEPIERWWGQVPDLAIVEQEEKMFRDATYLVAVSDSMKNLIKETYGLPGTQLSVVHNGIDAPRFLDPVLEPGAAAKLRQTIAAPDDKIILFCGRLNPQKGISALLDSAMIVMEEYPKACLVIAGEPDSKEGSTFLREKLEQNPILKKRIRLLGKLPRKQLALLYQIADVAVVPSVYEPFGYAAVEAMAAGAPVIATAAGGLAEIVQHERTGILVPVNVDGNIRAVDITKLASAQLMLLRNTATAKQFGKAGRQRVVEEFGLAKWGESMVRAYRDAINQF
ncbi:MAG: glycosyltransferase family 4 protein [Candidatus Angelobacter sp.]